MSNSRHRWLHDQLPQWERDGLLSSEAAHELRNRFPVDTSRPPLAQILLGTLGALLVGTGLIAVIGYNWDSFPRSVRLSFAFLPLLIAQGFNLRLLMKEKATWISEASPLFQSLAAGGALAIVSQVYHLGGDWPDFVFAWSLLSLPLVWVFRSSSVALFYLAGITVWTVHAAGTNRPWHEGPALYPLLLLGLLPYWPGWKVRAPLSVTMRWFIAISAFVGLFCAVSQIGEDVAPSLWSVVAAILLLLPLSRSGLAESTGKKPQVVLGMLWLLGFGLAITFEALGQDILSSSADALRQPGCWLLLAVLGALAGFAVKSRRWEVLAVATIALLPFLALPFTEDGGMRRNDVLSWIATAHLAGVGILLIVLEFAGARGAPRLGAALLSLLVVARMFDSDLSLLVKGLAFIVAGIAFLTFNFYLSRHLRRSLPTAP